MDQPFFSRRPLFSLFPEHWSLWSIYSATLYHILFFFSFFFLSWNARDMDQIYNIWETVKFRVSEWFNADPFLLQGSKIIDPKKPYDNTYHISESIILLTIFLPEGQGRLDPWTMIHEIAIKHSRLKEDDSNKFHWGKNTLAWCLSMQIYNIINHTT